MIDQETVRLLGLGAMELEVVGRARQELSDEYAATAPVIHPRRWPAVRSCWSTMALRQVALPAGAKSLRRRGAERVILRSRSPRPNR